MNRFKKYIRTKGYKLESDYPFLPYHEFETVEVDSTTCTMSRYYDCYGWIFHHFLPDGTIEWYDEDTPRSKARKVVSE